MSGYECSLIRGDVLSSSASVYVFSGSFNSFPVQIHDFYYTSQEQAQKHYEEMLPYKILRGDSILNLYECTVEVNEGWIKAVEVKEQAGRRLVEEIEERQQEGRYWTETEIVTFVHSLCRGLHEAQSVNLPHRDINPYNLFLNGSTLKLGNFVPVSASWNRVSNFSEHWLYLSPEAKRAFGQGAQYDLFKADIFSLAVTVLHMALLEEPKEMMEVNSMQEMTEMFLGRLSEWQWVQYCLRRMMDMDPVTRVSAADICMYLQQYMDSMKPALDTAIVQSYNSEEGQLTVDPLSQSTYESSYQGGNFQTSDQTWAQPENGYNTGLMMVDPLSGSGMYQAQNPQAFPTSYQPPEQQTQSVACQQCKKPITDSSWTNGLPENPTYKTFCSRNCFKAFCNPVLEEKGPKCDFCNRVMGQACEKTKVTLACGHVCHFKGCLFSYLAEKSNNFTKRVKYICPKCPAEITEKKIAEVFGGNKAFCEMTNSSQSKNCHKCGEKKTLRQLECFHRVCGPCLHKVLNLGVKTCNLCFKPYEISD